MDIDEDVLMVNHRGSASPLSINHEPEPMREVENPQVNGERQHPSSESRAMQTSVPAEIIVAGGDNTLPTPSPSQCEVDDLPAVFDLPSDVIYASVNELPKVDGSSLAQLPMYGPPVLTDEEYHNIMDAFPIVPISKFCLERFLSHDVDKVCVLYTHFINTINQKPTLQTLLPISSFDLPKKHEESAQEDVDPMVGYIFEPNALEVLDIMLPYYVEYQVFQMILDARASEHSARMVAMKNATDNANQFIKDLTLEYNKMRQAGITTELLEISTAQMALGG